MRALLLAIPVAAALAGSAAAQPAGGDAAHGHALFLADGCSECHGTVAQGGVGPRLAPNPIPADAIASYIRKPAGEMPAYVSAVVPDRDVRDIQAYLASVPQPPDVATLAELR